MTLFSLKFLIYEPKCLLLMSLLYNFSELLKKHQDAKSNNGVVGNNGMKIPITPNASDIEPITIRSVFNFQYSIQIRRVNVFYLFQDTLMRLYINFSI